MLAQPSKSDSIQLALTAAIVAFGTIFPSPGRGDEPAPQKTAAAASVSSQVVELLFSGALRTELELVPEQIEQLRDLGTERREKIAAAFRQVQGTTTAERRKKIEGLPEEYAKIDAGLEKGIDAVLLPHQQRRWRQIRTQATYRHDLVAALASQEVAKELGLSDREREALMVRLEKIKAEFQDELAELRRKTEGKIFAELSPPQRARLKELFGEPFFPPK